MVISIHGKIPIYWINLDRSKIRADTMRNRFATIAIKAIRTRALDGANKEEIKRLIKFSNHHSNWTGYGFRTRATPILDAEHACTASHILAIRQAYDDLCEVAVVMEDDVSFPLTYRADLHELVRTLPDQCEIIQLGCIGPRHALLVLGGLAYNGAHWIKRRDLFSRIYPPQVRACFGTQGYLIKRSAMKRIVDGFTEDGRVSLPYPQHIQESKCGALADELIYYFAGYGGLYSYVLTSPLICHDGTVSDINGTHF